jgi:Tol biopolymer transport system component
MTWRSFAGPTRSLALIPVICLFVLSAFTIVLLGWPGVAEAAVIDRISVASDGTQGNKGSSEYYGLPAISADGRYVAFWSYATNLVGGDTNNYPDVFLRDRATPATERVSVGAAGAQGDYGSKWKAGMSADGRYVAFESEATNLAPGDTNWYFDVFIRDREGGTTERVSVSTDGKDPDSPSYNPAMSADGRYVAFDSYATNLVAGDANGQADVFVRDRGGATELVSVASDGTQANGPSGLPAISADGRYVAYQSYATNLAPIDSNGALLDIFVRDRTGGVTELISVASDGTQGNAASWGAAVSSDGRYVAFCSDATNLAAGDTNGRTDVFVHDRVTGATERVSLATDGTQGDYNSGQSSISGNARYVAFESYATTLVEGDTNERADIFVRDRSAGTTQRVSVAADGMQGSDDSLTPAISADDRYVAFWSDAPNLVADDTNGCSDIFVASFWLNSLVLIPGWNLVAAAPGTTFPSVLFGWDGTSYTSTGDPAAWQGYWCKPPAFGTIEMQTVDGPHSIDLSAGWNLIGNPMGHAAALTLPAGSIAFIFNGATYASTTTLKPGQGAWVKGAAGQTVVLTPQ